MPKTIKNEIQTKITADDRFSRNVKKMSRGMQRFNRIAGRMKKALRAAGRAAIFLGRKAGQIAKVGLFAISGAATAVFLSVTKLAQGMDELAKSTRAVDFDIEKFQEFKFVAEQSGVSGEKFSTMVKKFSATVGEFKGGFGTMFTALKSLDPQLAKQLKGSKGTADAFELYLEAIRRAPNATKKAALASAAFGKRMGIDMINMANLSAEAVDKLRAQMRDNGVVTAEQAAKAERYNDMMNRLKLTLKGVAVEGLTPLMPLMTDGINRMRKWVVENRGLIKQKIETVFKNMLKYGKMAFDFLRQNVPPLISKLKKIGKDGFSWVKENKKEIDEFFAIIKAAGKMLINVTGFVWKNKEAVLALILAYKALGVSIGLLNWSGMASNAGTAIGGITGKVKGLAGIVGKGGLLASSLAAGVAIGTTLFNEWESSLDRILTKAQNVSATMGLKVNKMSDVELARAAVTEQKKVMEADSLWTGMRAVFTGRWGEVQETKSTAKQAQIDIVKEQLRRVTPQGKIDIDEEQPGRVTPQAQSTRTETVEKQVTEIVIRDETGKAEVTKGKATMGLPLVRTGA